MISLAQGNFEESESLNNKALAIREKVFGKTHVEIAYSLHNFGELYFAKSRYAPEGRICNSRLSERLTCVLSLPF